MASHAHVPGCARLNVGRLNAFRLNYAEPLTLAIIGGVNRSKNVRIEGAAVQHVLNDAPDTASVRVHGFTPVAGQRFDLYVSDQALGSQLLGGRVLETTVLYESRKQNVAYDLRAIDLTWMLNRRRILYQYRFSSATAIIEHLAFISNAWNGFTGYDIETGLPQIDELTFTNETVATCLTAICERVGAYWYQDYAGVLHVGRTQSLTAQAITDATPHGASNLTLTEDLSQIVTRVIARGGGGQVSADVPAAATEMPVDDPAWYSDAGGIVEVGGALRLTYTGVRGRAAVGALVGAGNAPTATPKYVQSYLYPALGANGITVGAQYQYAVSYVNESGTPPTLGESLVGPTRAAICTGLTPTPPLACAVRSHSTIPGSVPGPTVGGVYYFRLVFPWRFGTYQIGPVIGPYTYNGKLWEFNTGYNAPSPEGVWHFPDLDGLVNLAGVYGQVWIYRTLANAGPSGTFYSSGSIDVPQNVYYGQSWYTVNSGFMPPDVDMISVNNQLPVPGPAFNGIELVDLPRSSLASVKQRKIYRTAANGTQLKLAATIANNTQTTWLDQTPDASLGANAPTADNSGITDNRQWPAGSTTLPVSDVAPFLADSGGAGWVRVAGMPVAYTGAATGQLTGIPATGVGSLTATVRYGAQVFVQPRLVGVAGLTVAVKAGAAVVIRVELDDAAAQAALGTRLGGTAADGIVEEPYSDSRMGLDELVNYAKALLADRKDPRRTLQFQTRDTTVQVGRLITVTTTQPPISGTFRIQRVTFSEIAISGGLARTQPLRTVEATTKLYSFADLLRRLRGREGGAA